MSKIMVAGAARLGLAMAAFALAFAATSQPSAAQAGAAPASAPPAPAAAGDAAGKLAKGRELFDNFGCGSCHSLADASATGHVGPSLDGDANLTEAFVVSRVTTGQGGMPAFGDQMSPDEIAALAAYVTQTASK